MQHQPSHSDCEKNDHNISQPDAVKKSKNSICEENPEDFICLSSVGFHDEMLPLIANQMAETVCAL